MIGIDRQAIEAKKAKLDQVKDELKSEFVGIDYIIDDLINYLQIWYLMPEILTRPIIINLWGMTGVGKTDLIRKMVSKLEFQDRFAEVELSHGSIGWRDTVWSLLDDNGLNDGQPAIVLFDEIQKFASLDANGHPRQDVSFQDFWELLSDGKLAKREHKESIERYVNSYLFDSAQRKKKQVQQNNEANEAEPEAIGLWEASQVKKLFDFEEDAFKLAEMKPDELLNRLLEKRSKKKIYEAVNHAKTLIIISGNLDDAFTMANATGETDVDADIFHAFTEKITLIDIKNSLSKIFRPEQVARFGNIHLIYKSLKKEHFRRIIATEIDRIVVKTKLHFGIELTVDKSLHRLIYQNGVFPAQGVRPVFSSVIDILESHLSKFVFEALISDATTIRISYDYPRYLIKAQLGEAINSETKYIGRIDKIRDNNLTHLIANVSVHECGHAVAYAVLFGLAPLQLKSKVASTYVSGFTFPHQIYHTQKSLLRKIQVYLAGGIAEELVFGKDLATIGRENDREEATKLAIGYIRKFGFDEDYQAYYSSDETCKMKIQVTDKSIEYLMKEMARATTELLENQRDFLTELSQHLYRRGTLNAAEIAEVAARHQVEVGVKEEGYMYIENYEGIVDTETRAE
jgi:cell division protease FtsH